MGSTLPMDFGQEHTVVLPQRYRARVVRTLPHGPGTVLVLVQDFTRPPAGQERGPEFNHLEPIWRLYRYDLPGVTATELCSFSQPETLHPVHMATASDGVYLLFHSQLLRLDVRGRVVEGLCRLNLPGEGTCEVRGLAVRPGVACITVEHETDQISLHWVPLDDRPAFGVEFPGARGESLAFGPGGEVYALDLLDLYCYRDAQLVAERDLCDDLGEWARSPLELLSVAADGRVFVAAGDRLLALTPDLRAVLGEWRLEAPPQDLGAIPGSSSLLLTSVDPVAGLLRFRDVRL